MVSYNRCKIYIDDLYSQIHIVGRDRCRIECVSGRLLGATYNVPPYDISKPFDATDSTCTYVTEACDPLSQEIVTLLVYPNTIERYASYHRAIRASERVDTEPLAIFVVKTMAGITEPWLTLD